MGENNDVPRDDVRTAMEFLAACTPTSARPQYAGVLRAMISLLLRPIDKLTEPTLRTIVRTTDGAHLPTNDLLAAAEFAAVAHIAASDARRSELHESMRYFAELLERIGIRIKPVAA